MKKLTKPSSHSYMIGNNPVIYLSTRTVIGVLILGGP